MKKDYKKKFVEARELLDELIFVDKKIKALLNEGEELIEKINSVIPIECSKSDSLEKVIDRFEGFADIINANIDFNFNGELDSKGHTARIMTYGNQFAIEFIRYYDNGRDYGYTRNTAYIYDTLEEAEDKFISLMLVNRIIFNKKFYRCNY